MVTRRRLLPLTLFAALVLLSVCGWMLWPAPSAISREAFEKIQPGTTLAEVEELLGGPARDESSGPRIKVGDPPAAAESSVYLFHLETGSTRLRHPCKLWESDRVVIRVDFDREFRVTGKECLNVRRIQAPPLDVLRRWLGL